MKKIRLGNDIPIEWAINRNDQPEDFTGKTLRLTMIGTSGTTEVTDYTIEGNVLRWMFWGKDQHKPSTYHFCLVENGGEEGMFTIDTCDVLKLVNRSCAADDCDGPFTMQITSCIDDKGVTCSSVITVPANGLSAYEIAVRHGFGGTEEEWLESLKGEDGKDGIDGKTPILKSGTTNTLDTGQSATASLVRDGEDEAGNPVYKANFGIPRGPQGERGEAGKDGVDGSDGADGKDGSTFTPSVSEDGTLSWTNDGGLDNPETVNIKGPKGDTPDTSGLQPKTDESLQTTDKTVTGAINEVNQAVKTKQDKLKAGTGVEITSDNTVNVTLDTTVFKVVASLPESPAAGDENKIHLVPAESTEEGNIYTEYVFVNGKWEEFGTYRSEVDLTQYLKNTDAEATYQKITDNTLATTAKTVVGAINEVKSSSDTNTGNATRIDRAVGQPAIEDIDLTSDIEAGYLWNTNGIKTSNAQHSVKYVSLNKGDLLIANVMSSSNISQLTVVDSTHTKAVQLIDSEGEGSIYVKSSFLADKDCIVAISRYGTTLIGEEYAYIVKSVQNTATADIATSTAALHKVYESYGAVYNEETGYWEMEGITDLTEDDMLEIYLCTTHLVWANPEQMSNISPICSYNPRIIFIPAKALVGLWNGYNLFSNMSNAEKIVIQNGKLLILSQSLHALFANCSKLREVSELYLGWTPTFDSKYPTFRGNTQLAKINISALCSDLSFADSPLISYGSLNYIVTNASNTSAITITVHPTTYSYLTGTAQPTVEVGGTIVDWKILAAAAQSKQISFAVPEETQAEVTE